MSDPNPRRSRRWIWWSLLADVVLAHAGRLWIADPGNHRIVTIPITGTLPNGR